MDLKILNDPRDLPVCLALFLPSFIFLPVAALIMLRPDVPLWVFPLYWIPLITFGSGPFTIALHLYAHRPFFSDHHPITRNVLDFLVNWIIAPLFGHVPLSYRVTHLGTHHVENNGHDDVTTTLPYRRNSLWDFLRYFFRHLPIGSLTLGPYLSARGRRRWIIQARKGEIYFSSLLALALYANPRAATLVLIIPFVSLRWVIFAGNYAQHAFAEDFDAQDPLTFATTILSPAYNRFYFNDGYHVEHHLDPRAHWTELPARFEARKEEYRRKKAMIFEDVDFYSLWFFLCFGFEKKLARKFVDLSGNLSEDEIIALIRKRSDRV